LNYSLPVQARDLTSNGGHGGKHSGHGDKHGDGCDMTLDKIAKFWREYNLCYESMVVSEDCDSTCIGNFYTEFDAPDPTSSFSWYDGPLGGQAWGNGRIIEQAANECNLFKKLAPGATGITKAPQDFPQYGSVSPHTNCEAIEKGSNIWSFTGTKYVLEQRFSYVLVEVDGKIKIFDRHASVAEKEPGDMK
jgi:hypothetical protein